MHKLPVWAQAGAGVRPAGRKGPAASGASLGNNWVLLLLHCLLLGWPLHNRISNSSSYGCPRCPAHLPEHEGGELEEAECHGSDAHAAVGGVGRHARAGGVLDGTAEG